MTNFDEILVEAGEFGRFQKRVFGLFCLVSMPWACVFVGIVFQGFTPEHWCRNPAVEDLRGKCGWTLEEERKYTVPLINTTTGPAYSQCQRYDVDWNSTISCGSPQPNFTFNHGNHVPLTTCQDGWVFDYKQRSSFVTEVWPKAMFSSVDTGKCNYWDTCGYLAQLHCSGHIPGSVWTSHERFTSAVVYQGLIMRLGILGGNVYIDFLISGVVEFPAAFLIIVTIERMGRRIPFTLSNIVSGAACLIAAVIPECKLNNILVGCIYWE
ncbi:UNVERIFIED_CONTAM: hypothetical protein FKN15_013240 [Acipenser sinensis]